MGWRRAELLGKVSQLKSAERREIFAAILRFLFFVATRSSEARPCYPAGQFVDGQANGEKTSSAKTIEAKAVSGFCARRRARIETRRRHERQTSSGRCSRRNFQKYGVRSKSTADGALCDARADPG